MTKPTIWDRLRRRVAMWTLTLAVLAGLATAVLAGQAQAMSVVAGVMIGALDFGLLAGAVSRLLDQVQAAPDEHRGGARRIVTAWVVLRWPVAALATAAVLWYMPGRPEGLAVGVFAALTAFCLAALQSRADLDDDRAPDR